MSATRSQRLEKRVAGRAARHLQGADAMAEGAGRAPSGPAALPRLCQGPVLRLHAACRRPQLRRRQRHRRRLRALSRRAGGGDRPGKGLRHQEPAEAQFRLGAARGLPQGGAHHGTGRPLQRADDHAGRHGRRLSRHRRGRARPGGGHRPLDLGLPFAEGSVDVGRDRRRRVGRRDRDRHGQSRLHAGACDLFGDLAGRRRLDPVARHDPLQGCGDQHEDHRAGSARL